MTATAFPLTWPAQFPRTKYREDGRFKTALPNAIKNVQGSLRNFASDSGKSLKNLVISSNVTLGVDAPADPGVAVWFEWDDLQVCIPVDRYRSVASNLQAIHHIIARHAALNCGTARWPWCGRPSPGFARCRRRRAAAGGRCCAFHATPSAPTSTPHTAA